MKKYFVLLNIALLFSTLCIAQNSSNEWELINSAFGKEKKQMMAKFVQLPDDNVFWNFYREFEKERKQYSNESYHVLLDYAENYVNYSDDKLEQIMADNMRVRSKMDELLETYYLKIKDECGVKTASQFWMIQRYFESMLRANMLGNLPILEK